MKKIAGKKFKIITIDKIINLAKTPKHYEVKDKIFEIF